MVTILLEATGSSILEQYGACTTGHPNHLCPEVTHATGLEDLRLVQSYVV